MLAALKGGAAENATPLWKLVNPYRGLEAMTEANADYFYGRGGETAGVLNALAAKPDRLPILIGASGVGKSSVAQAGVLAALKAMRWPSIDGAASNAWPPGLSNSRSFLTLMMRPGDAPLEALAGVFIGLWGLDSTDPEQATLPRKWAKGLSAGDNKLADLIGTTQERLKKRQGEAPERVLLYLDQGEELYTRAAQQEAHRFSEVLNEGLHDPRMFAFASLRADYYDRFQADEPLFNRREHVDVPPLDRAQLQRVVTAPAAALGVSFEDDKIADRITAAAAAEPGALPLLSYLLTDMWAEMVQRDKPVLGLSAHAIDIGGVLASRAENFLKENPEEQKALRRLLTLRFAIVPPEGEPVRRQTFREECSEAEWALAARLADYPYRLVVMSEREIDGHVVAEVAHEAFLRAWPQLAQWLREERDFLVFKGEVERSERRWHEMTQADRALLTGLDLARAEEWLPKRSGDLSPEVTAYIQRSIACDRAAKERQLRFQRRVTLGSVAAMLVILIIGAFAWIKWGDADQARSLVVSERNQMIKIEANFLAGLARQAHDRGDNRTAIALALQALPDPTLMGRIPNTVEALLHAALADYRAAKSRGITVFFSPDGGRIATVMPDFSIQISDAATRKVIIVLRGPEDEITSGAFSPDGSRIAAASFDKTVRVWDAVSGKLLITDIGHSDFVSGVVFSPDSRLLATFSADHTARVWDAAVGREITVLLNNSAVESGAFSPDGRHLAVALDSGAVVVFDIRSGEGQYSFNYGDRLFEVAYSLDGNRIAAASSVGDVPIWDVATRRLISVLRATRQ